MSSGNRCAAQNEPQTISVDKPETGEYRPANHNGGQMKAITQDLTDEPRPIYHANRQAGFIVCPLSLSRLADRVFGVLRKGFECSLRRAKILFVVLRSSWLGLRGLRANKPCQYQPVLE